MTNTRITIWLEMYQMKSFIEMGQSPLFMLLFISSWFDKTGIYSVSYITDEYYINHFGIMIIGSSIPFSRVIIIQDFKTVIFNVLLAYKPIFSGVFC